MNKIKINKFWKVVLIVILSIAIPSFIIIAILYSNNKDLLHKFEVWINEPGNLSTFIITIGLYFPFLNGLWRLILNIYETIIKKQTAKKSKLNKVKIYDDDKYNYIYYDKENNILDIQFKANESVSLEKLTDMIYSEVKQKTKIYDKKEK